MDLAFLILIIPIFCVIGMVVYIKDEFQTIIKIVDEKETTND